MNYFILLMIIFLSACSLDKNSTYWNKDSINKSADEKKLSKIINKNADFKSITFDEFDLFLKDYSYKAEYPNIND